MDSWTEHRLATNDYGYLNAITYGSDQFVVVGTLNSSQFVHWNSSVGDNWKPTISEASGLVKGRLNALTYGDGNFVAVGTLGKILTSPDATHWTAGTTKTSDWKHSSRASRGHACTESLNAKKLKGPLPLQLKSFGRCSLLSF